MLHYEPLDKWYRSSKTTLAEKVNKCTNYYHKGVIRCVYLSAELVEFSEQ